MNAQKKHLKELKRRKKREKGQEKLAVPFRVELVCSRDSKLKNFEEVALLNIHIKKIARELWLNDKVFRDCWRRYMSGYSPYGFLDCTYEIINQIIKHGGAVPPYFVPLLADLSWERLPFGGEITKITFEILRPQREKDDSGTIYHFGTEVKFEDKSYPIWFTGHALDRLQERLKLTNKHVSLWMAILGNSVIGMELDKESLRSSWSCVKDTFYSEGGHKLECGVFGAHIDKTVDKFEARRLPLYFGAKIEGERVIAKTFLLPGMCGTPPIPNFDNILADIVSFWSTHGLLSLVKKRPTNEKSVDPVSPIRYKLECTEAEVTQPPVLTPAVGKEIQATLTPASSGLP